MERVYTIRTPEMVRFDFRLAGPGARALAWAIDLAVLLGVLGIFAGLSCLASALIYATVRSEIGFALLIVGFFLIFYGYFAFFEWRWSGRTIGKRAVGLRVIQDNGARVAPFQVIVRNLFRIVDAPLVAFGAPIPTPYPIGTAAILGTRRGQRLGDLVAGTIVVREDREAEMPKAASLQDEFGTKLMADKALLRRMTRRLTKNERELLVDAARRADEIDLEVRGPLFERLGKHLARRLEMERDPHVSDEKLVQNLARALLAHEREGGAGIMAAGAPPQPVATAEAAK